MKNEVTDKQRLDWFESLDYNYVECGMKSDGKWTYFFKMDHTKQEHRSFRDFIDAAIRRDEK